MTPSPTASAGIQQLTNPTTWIIIGAVCVAMIAALTILSAYKRKKARAGGKGDPFAHMKRDANVQPAKSTASQSDFHAPDKNSSFAKYGRKANDNDEK